jgi:hypothetical protein
MAAHFQHAAFEDGEEADGAGADNGDIGLNGLRTHGGRLLERDKAAITWPWRLPNTTNLRRCAEARIIGKIPTGERFGQELRVDRLIKFWGGDYAEPPYVHAEDGFYVRKPYPLPFDLMPQPWRGDMFQSKVFLLRLAPALSKPTADYEKSSAAFRQAIKRQLAAELA